KVNVSIGYDASATSIVLSSGQGAKLPSSNGYNLAWWNSTDYNDPSDDPNVEIVRVTARSTDTLTVTRAQESTSASTKNTVGKTYKMVLSFTKKTYDDLANAVTLGNITANSSPIASGTNTYVLFDDNGVVGEDAGFTYAKATDTLGIGSIVSARTTTEANTAYSSIGLTLSNTTTLSASNTNAGLTRGALVTTTIENAG